MKVKIKKIIASILTFMMIFTQVPTSVFEVHGYGASVDKMSSYDEVYSLFNNNRWSEIVYADKNTKTLKVKLLRDRYGELYFNCRDNTHIIFDANGKTIDPGNNEWAICLESYSKMTMELIGNGKYEKGSNGSLFSNTSNKIILKSGTIVGNTYQYAKISASLENGYSYYTISSTDPSQSEYNGKTRYYTEKDVRVNENYELTVNQVDQYSPETEIQIGETKWNSFRRNMTFGDYFFNNNQIATITASDNASGVGKCYYYVDTRGKNLDMGTESHIQFFKNNNFDWVEATTTSIDENTVQSTIPLSDYDKCIIFVKVLDKSGNTTYINTDGLTSDNETPQITGIESGKTYTKSKTFTVTDTNLATVKVDGNVVEPNDKGEYTLVPKEGKYEKIEAVDNAGNKTTLNNITVNWEIVNKPTVNSKTYTGETLIADISDNNLYKVIKNDGGVDVGEYDVELNLKDNVNYKWEDGNNIVKFNITKATPSISKKPTGKTLKYNKNQQELVTEGETNGGTLYYKLGDNGEWSTNIPTAKSVGTYKIYYYVEGDKNHNDYYPEKNYVESTIGKNIPNVTVTPVSELTYNGSNQNLISKVDAPEGVTVQYKVNNGNWSTTLPTAKNAGTYTVYYKAIGGEQYSDVAEQSVSVTIKPRSVKISGIKANDKVYDGTTDATLDFNNVTFDGKCGDDQLSITATGQFVDANAGEGEVTLKNLALGGKDKGNYVLSDNSQTSTTATITPKSIASATVTLDSENKTYMFNNRNAITPIVTVKDGEKLLGINDFELTENKSATDYGTYTLNVVGKGNYQGTIPVEWKIDENIAPTGTIKIGNNAINKVLNALTFGYFFKETKTVTITGEDGEGQSGVKDVYYYLSNEVLSTKELEDIEWIEGNSVDINPNNKYVIYAKIVDNAGNSCVVNSDGIVLYSDSSQVTTNLEYTKTTKNNLQATVSLNGNTIKDISVDNAKLSTDDYTVDQGTITIKGEWLDTLAAGQHTLTVSYNPLGEKYVNNTNNQAPSTTQIALKVLKTNGQVSNLSNISKTYDGNPIDKPTFDKLGNGTATIEYEVNGKYTNIAPKDAGTYKVKVTVGEDNTYNAASNEREFTISPKKINVKVNAEDKEYDGNANATVSGTAVTGIDDESISITGLTGTFNDKNVEKANTVTANTDKVNVTGNANTNVNNYRLVYPQTASASITPKTINIDWENTTLTYNGKNQLPTAKATNLVDGDKCYITVTGDNKDVGTYNAKATSVNNSNYKLPKNSTTEYLIKPKDIIVTITPNGGTYNETITPAKAKLNGLEENDNPAVTLTYSGTANDGTIVSGTEVPSLAGTYTVTASINDNNYKLTGTTNAEFKVKGANANLIVEQIGTKEYGDDNFNLKVRHEGNGKLSYTSSNEDVATVDDQGNVTIHNAGTTKLKVTLGIDHNYDSDSKEVTLTVNKIDHKLKIEKNTIEKTYGDEQFTINATSDNESSIEYTSNNENIATVDNQGRVTIKGAGKVTITVSQKESKNYYAVTKEVNLTVKAKKITVTAEDKEKVYLEKDKELTYTSDKLVGSDKLTDITLSRKEGESVGTYKIIANQKEKSNPNYDIEFKDGKYTIKPLAINQGTVVLGKVLRYTGEKQTQEVESVLVNGKVLAKDNYEVVDNQATKDGKHVLRVKAKGNNCIGSFEYNYVILPKENKEIGTGSFTVKTTGNVEIDRDDLIDLLIENKEITANELSEVSQGKKIEVILDVKDGKASEAIKENTKEYKVGKYLDITLYKNVDGTNESIHELAKALKVTLILPEELVNKDASIKREYFIARRHEGKVDILKAKYDDKKNTLMFETDRFSDYAILYKDTQVNQENIQVIKTQELKTKEKIKKVKTGDDTNIIGLTVLLLCSLGVLVFVKRKEEKNQ